MFSNKYILIIISTLLLLLVSFCYSKYTELKVSNDNLVLQCNNLEKNIHELSHLNIQRENEVMEYTEPEQEINYCSHITKGGKKCLKNKLDGDYCKTHEPKGKKKNITFIDTTNLESDTELFEYENSDVSENSETEEI